MNTIIKMIALAFLMSMPLAYGMENNLIVPDSKHLITMPDDLLKEIFSYAYSSHNTQTAIVLRLVCKKLNDLFNPLAIKETLNMHTQLIVTQLRSMNITKKNYHYIKLLADMIKDQPDLYTGIIGSLILDDRYGYSNDSQLRKKLEIFFKNGAHPNHYYNVPKSSVLIIDGSDFISKTEYYTDKPQKSFLIKTTHKKELFKLFLQYGADIYQDTGDGISAIEHALNDAENGKSILLNAIVEEKGDVLPAYQERIKKAVAFEKKKNRYLAACLLFIGFYLTYHIYTGPQTQCTLF